MGVCYRLYPDLFGYVTDHVVVNRDIFSEQNCLYKNQAPVLGPLFAHHRIVSAVKRLVC